MAKDLMSLEEEERREERVETEPIRDDSQTLTSLLSPKRSGQKGRRWRVPLLIILLVGIGVAGFLYYQEIFPRMGVGALSVYSRPAGAKIYINGEERGETPRNIGEIPADEYTIKLTLDGFEEYGEVIKILPNKRTEVKAALTKSKPVEIASLAQEPPKQEPEVPKPAPQLETTGTQAKQEPVKPTVTAKPEAVKPTSKPEGGRPLEPKPEVAKPEKARTSLQGNIHVSSTPSPAHVYLVGVYKGKTPITLKNLEAWKAYELKLILKGYKKWVSQVFTDPQKTARFEITLEPSLATSLYITSIPNDASIYLDGRNIGMTPLRGIAVDEGEHLVKVTKAGFKDAEKGVVVREGETNFVNFTLEKSGD